MSRYWAVIPAAGVGSRMKIDRPKQYLEIQGITILEHAINCLLHQEKISGVVVAVSPDDLYWKDIEKKYADMPVESVLGGQERCHSVSNGVAHLLEHQAKDDWVLVHDAARPCLHSEDIDRLIKAVGEHACGGLLGLPVADTLKYCAQQNTVEKTVAREQLWRALTPQMFRLGDLYSALMSAAEKNLLVTDESSAMELAGFHPIMVEGHPQNIKVTHPQDLSLARLYIESRNI